MIKKYDFRNLKTLHAALINELLANHKYFDMLMANAYCQNLLGCQELIRKILQIFSQVNPLTAVVGWLYSNIKQIYIITLGNIIIFLRFGAIPGVIDTTGLSWGAK